MGNLVQGLLNVGLIVVAFQMSGFFGVICLYAGAVVVGATLGAISSVFDA